jgi:1,4-dihydroxy-2-naphthoate polyprenyltransferase
LSGVNLGAWLQAARPLAAVNIAVPLAVGQALAFMTTGAFDARLCALVFLAGLLDQLAIVFANDVADEAGDRLHEAPTPFSGGSRVLPEGRLTARQLGLGAWLATAGLATVTGFTAVTFDRPALVPLWSIGLGLLWAYSFAPARLSYRGFGEATQGLGVGVVLPLLGFYAQAGSLDTFVWPALVPLFLLGVASNITTGLPDLEADRACGKSTWAVRFGLDRARLHALQLTAIAAFMTPWALPDFPRWSWAAVEALPAIALLAAFVEHRRAPNPDRRSRIRTIVLQGVAANATMVGWVIAAVVGAPR